MAQIGDVEAKTRLAQALRDNLRKRKAQQRERRQSAAVQNPAGSTPKLEPFAEG
jgi:hypothetical protein